MSGKLVASRSFDITLTVLRPGASTPEVIPAPTFGWTYEAALAYLRANDMSEASGSKFTLKVVTTDD